MKTWWWLLSFFSWLFDTPTIIPHEKKPIWDRIKIWWTYRPGVKMNKIPILKLGLSGLGLPSYEEWAAGAAEGERMLTELRMLTNKEREELLVAFKQTDLSFEQFYVIVKERFSMGLEPLGWINHE